MTNETIRGMHFEWPGPHHACAASCAGTVAVITTSTEQRAEQTLWILTPSLPYTFWFVFLLLLF